MFRVSQRVILNTLNDCIYNYLLINGEVHVASQRPQQSNLHCAKSGLSCLPLRGQPNGQKRKEKKNIPRFILPNILASCDKLSLDFINAFNM